MCLASASSSACRAPSRESQCICRSQLSTSIKRFSRRISKQRSRRTQSPSNALYFGAAKRSMLLCSRPMMIQMMKPRWTCLSRILRILRNLERRPRKLVGQLRIYLALKKTMKRTWISTNWTMLTWIMMMLYLMSMMSVIKVKIFLQGRQLRNRLPLISTHTSSSRSSRDAKVKVLLSISVSSHLTHLSLNQRQCKPLWIHNGNSSSGGTS